MTRRIIITAAALALLCLPLAAWGDNQNLQKAGLDGTWITNQPQNNNGKITTLIFEVKPALKPGTKGFRGWAVSPAGKQQFYWKPGATGASIVATNVTGYPGTQHFYIKWVNAKTIQIIEPSNHDKSKWVKR